MHRRTILYLVVLIALILSLITYAVAAKTVRVYASTYHVIHADGPAADQTRLLLVSWQPEPSAIYPIRLLSYDHFTVGYDEASKSPAWVRYHLVGPILFHGYEHRPQMFTTELRTAAHVAHRDYSGCGYDRGHMAPAYAFFSRFGDDAMRETFIMSNVIPQAHALNAGPWEQLESAIAGRDGLGDGWAAQSSEGVWVVDGPVYDTRPASTQLRNGTWIPMACWMAVWRWSGTEWRSQAWLFPNEQKCSGPLAQFETTLGRIRIATGVVLTNPDR